MSWATVFFYLDVRAGYPPEEQTNIRKTEETVRTVCKGITRHLETAATVDGSETVIEYVNSEEKVHVILGPARLLTASASDVSCAGLSGVAVPSHTPAIDL